MVRTRKARGAGSKSRSAGYRYPLLFGTVLALSSALAAPPGLADESVLYNFAKPAVGYPAGRLLLVNGHFFGTASGQGNGSNGYGQVFELVSSRGTWKEKTLVTFTGTNGAYPMAGLIRAPSGLLYGTTAAGGPDNGGTVFCLQNSGGQWKYSISWGFGAQNDGSSPTSDLVLNGAGTIFGTTQHGGTFGGGTAFMLTLSNGSWFETILHDFGNGSDGAEPYAGLYLNKSGVLFGTTASGGTNGGGTVFELTQSQGRWSEEVISSLPAGSAPLGALIAGSGGSLYGTSATGGSAKGGYVFELTKSKAGWNVQSIYDFSDGDRPTESLQWVSCCDQLVGTTAFGGANGGGTLFELTEGQDGWDLNVLHDFGGSGDGSDPESPLILDRQGNIYGTTNAGGTRGYGTAFQWGV